MLVNNPEHGVTFRQALRVWAKIGLLGFGGPAGQIALMHRILVQEKRWISESRFLHALNYCMLLPGPEAQQLAIYIGWLLHRTWGGIAAGVLFVLPGFFCILALSMLYAGYSDLKMVEGLFYGMKAAVLALVLEAVFRIGRKALKSRFLVGLSAAAFFAIFFLEAPFPLIILAAAVAGFMGGRFRPGWFPSGSGHQAAAPGQATEVISDHLLAQAKPSLGGALRVLGVCAILWFGPLVALWFWLGPENVYVQEGLFFSKAAVVTFGGAYAVLAYIAQQAVEVYGWLDPGQMIDGLGMAETTPGPLIMVVEFVGFMGAWRQPGPLHPMLAGTLAAVLVTWVTFVPCFLWIFLGAPYIEWLRGKRLLANGLSAITAAVVGVILNLALWFGLHVIFKAVDEVHHFGLRFLVPEWSGFDPASALISAGAFLMLFWLRLGMIKTLAASLLVGWAWFMLG